MTESILDRLDRDPGGARQYVATLIVIGGASRAKVAEALARKYNIPAPTGRSVTAWKSGDSKLRALIEQTEAAKRDVAPGGDPTDLLPEPVNVAQVDADLFSLADEFPAFGDLMRREAERAEDTAPTTAWGAPESPAAASDDDGDPPPADDIAVLLAEHETAAAFEADCKRRLGDYTPHPV
jgi:hypothetical protein